MTDFLSVTVRSLPHNHNSDLKGRKRRMAKETNKRTRKDNRTPLSYVLVEFLDRDNELMHFITQTVSRI